MRNLSAMRRAGLWVMALAAAGAVWPAPGRAGEITMTIAQTCGLSAEALQVQIWNPPGGYAAVSGKNTVTVNVSAGTKLSVGQKPAAVRDPGGHPKPHRNRILGPWTPAQDGGTLPVECVGHTCPACSERPDYFKERFWSCFKDKAFCERRYADCWKFCSGWMGCEGHLGVGSSVLEGTCE